MASVANLLLQITGDPEDAREALRDVARDLSALDRMEAEADVDVDTGKARAQLRELRSQLSSIDRERVSPDIDVAIAGAMAKIAALELQLAALDRQDVDVDIDVRRGIAEQLASVAAQVQHLAGPVLGGLASSATQAGSSVQGLGGGMGSFQSMTRVAHPAVIALAAGLIAVLVPSVIAVGGALAAMVASLAAAAAGLGALAIAFGAAFLPAIALGIGAIQRFKAQSEIAGTAANSLKNAATRLGSTFTRALAPAADAAMRGVASAMRSVTPVIRSLRGSFTVLGRAVGGAFRQVGQALASPEIRAGLAQLITGTARLVGPITRGLIAFGQILLNIANAAMPFLVRGASSVADMLERWAAGTSNAGRLREIIGTLIGHLGSWLNLGAQVAKVFLEFFKVAAPYGKSLVDDLARGAAKLAEWISSAEGTQAIKKFFTDTLPLVKEIATAVGDLIVVFLRFTQATAPVLVPLIQAFTRFLGIVNRILGAFGSLPTPIRTALGVILTGLLSPITLIARLIGLVGGLGGVFRLVGTIASAVWTAIKVGATALWVALTATWNAIKVAAVAAWGALRAAASAIWNGIKTAISTAARAAAAVARSIWNGARAALRAIWNGIKTAASAVWNAIKTAISTAVKAAVNVVKSLWNGAKSTLRSIWNGIKSAASSVWNGIKSTVSRLVRGAVNTVKSLWNGAKGAISDIWNGIKGAASRIWGSIKTAISDAVRDAVNKVKDLAQAAFDAGKAIVQKIADGMKSAIGAIKDAAGSVLDAAKSALPIKLSPLQPAELRKGLYAGGQEMVRLVATGLAHGVRQSAQIDIGGLTPQLSVAAPGVPVPGPAGGDTINQSFHIASPAAHGQPDPRATAAQLALLLRTRG